MDQRVVADLARSGILPEDINAEVEDTAGFTEPDGYIIPYYLSTGERHPTLWRKKLFRASENGSRYIQSVGEPTIYPYFSNKVVWAEERKSPVKYIVEGEKKAVSAIKNLALPAIGIGGCWMWQEPGVSSYLLRPLNVAFLEVLKRGDLVRVVFDGDFRTNPDVEHAMAELRLALREHGCRSEFVILPDAEERLGLDDWIVETGATAEAFERLPSTEGAEFREAFASVVHRTQPAQGDNGPHTTAENLRVMLSGIDYFTQNIYYDTFQNVWFCGINSSGVGPPQRLKSSDFASLTGVINHRLWHRARKNMVMDAMDAMSSDAAFSRNPLVEYLTGLEWDGKDRLHVVFSEIFGASENDYTKTVGRMWFIGLVARALRPGCKNDTMLILEGRQGLGKSRALAIIGGQYHIETATAMDNKDFMMELAGKWIVDLTELGSFRNTDMNHVKGVLSKTCDDFRPPYGHVVESFPRRCVIVGTTNEYQYLPDMTGNRRYWPIRCGPFIATIALAQLKDQLLAEAVHRFKAGEKWYFDEETDPVLAQLASEIQGARAALDPWLEPIRDYLASGKLRRLEFHGNRVSFCTNAEVLLYLHIDPSAQNMATAKRVSRLLQALGWEIHNKLRRSQVIGAAPDDETGPQHFNAYLCPAESPLPSNLIRFPQAKF